MSKLLKFFLITTLTIPTIFSQSSCTNKKGDELEKEVLILNEKIKDLEKIKATLSLQLEPFNNLMTKYKVNNFDDLMEKLTVLMIIVYKNKF